MSWLLELTCAFALGAPQDFGILGTTVHDPGVPGRKVATLVVRDRRIDKLESLPFLIDAIGGKDLSFPGQAHVYPGLQDAHGHVLGLGKALENVDLTGCATFDEVVARVVTRAKQTPKGEWVEGRGW